jgi:MarR family transcriptional regulator, transcriptional regulator for hemolysin
MAIDDRMSNFTFLLREVSRRFVVRFEEHARAISLTLSQCKVLVRLEKNEGVSQARLAELTDLDAMTMVRILDRMESEGFLERRADPADRRARCLYLTAKARPFLAEIQRLGDLTRSEVFGGIQKSELDSFMDVLERMDDNLNRLEGKASVTLRQAGQRS